MSSRTITVNRAPVLTPWAAVVAERLGHDEVAALSLGRAVAALNAQSKGRKLGLFKPREKGPEEERREELPLVEVCGRAVPVRETEHGPRAVLGGKVIRPNNVRKSLASAFGADLKRARSALEKLAGSFEPAELERRAYALYEQFRPAVPEGTRGWGARGEFDPALVRRLARRPARARKR